LRTEPAQPASFSVISSGKLHSRLLGYSNQEVAAHSQAQSTKKWATAFRFLDKVPVARKNFLDLEGSASILTVTIGKSSD